MVFLIHKFVLTEDFNSQSIIFATSIDYNLLGSYLWVCVMVASAWAGIHVTDRINITQHMDTIDKTPLTTGQIH